MNDDDNIQQRDFEVSPPDNGMEVESDDVELVDQGAAAPHPLALVAPTIEVDDEDTNHGPPDSYGRISPAVSTVSTEQNEASNEGSSRKRSYSEDVDDDGSLCPICLDDWTNTGEHRICSLKCGHLFGHKCIIRWLSGQKKKSCPTCKKRVGRDDIRYIYAKKLTAVDTSEIENLKAQLEVVTAEKTRLQNQIATCTVREVALNEEIKMLRLQLQNLAKTPYASNQINERPIERVQLFMDKAMEICKLGGSRVFDAKSGLNLLMASVKSPSNLFSGFGLKKINIADYRTLAFIPAHSLPIRDICFHKESNWVLTASMDKTFKVINNNENSVIYQAPHQMPLWSCCWDANNPFGLFVGTQSGSVIRYDIRRLTEPTCTLSIEGDMSPVVSLASIPSSPDEVLPHGGVVCCKLSSLWLYENVNNDFQRHALSLEGPFVSMKYQESTKQLLVSSRPNSRIAYARHTLSTFDKKEDTRIDCNIVHTFEGGGMQKLLSKSCFLSHKNDYVAAHQENCKSVFLWSINTGQKVTAITAHDTVLDLKGLQTTNGNFLISLTDKKLEFFKFS